MSNDLVARLRNYANECGGGQLEDDLNEAIAALTAQPSSVMVPVDAIARACNLAGVDYSVFMKIKAYLPDAAAKEPK